MTAYHLGIDDVGGASIALVPGDPGRVPRIARALDPGAVELGLNREFCTWSASVEGQAVLVTSTGIGGPSTAIVVEELARLGIETFLRVGTTGALQEYVEVGDLVLVHGAVRLDGASTHFAPPNYPAVADFEVLRALKDAAADDGLSHHVGVVVSSDTFYPGQERLDTHSGWVLRTFEGSAEEWRKLQCLGFEMEAATLFTACRVLGLRAGCVLGVIVNRCRGEDVNPAEVPEVEDRAIGCAVGAVRRLLDPVR